MRLMGLGLQLLLLLLAACTCAPPRHQAATSAVPVAVVGKVASDLAPTTPAVIADPAPATPIAGESAMKGKPPSALAPAPIHPPIARESTVHKPTAPVLTPATATSMAATPAVAIPPAAAAPLDLAALKQRLRDTPAIGVFTKLSLKNQVDDLLDQFRTHYRSSGPPAPSALRQHYDLLILKVLSLLQDRDPALARTIGSSREAIWGILSDPTKLAAI